MEDAKKVSAMDDRKLREEYGRVKNKLHRGFRYGLWCKVEAELSRQLAVLEAELKTRQRDSEAHGAAAED